MPRWARLATKSAPVVNALLGVRLFERFALLVGGMDTRRQIPRFARRTFSSRWHSRTPLAGDARLTRERATKVLLWGDTFSDNFSPEILRATTNLLESAGYEVIMPPDVCCGLTWITTGQLETARKKLAAVVDALHPYVERGIPVLGVEPSCTAVLRSDLRELLPNDDRAQAVSHAVRTVAELLTDPPPTGPGAAWLAPDLTGVDVLVQPHCHQHSVMGFSRDVALLENLGATVKALAGCCGLAGNFGMEAGHYDVSVKVAQNALLPALASLRPDTVFLADGLSCRTQAEQLGGVKGLHLAQLLAGEYPQPKPMAVVGK
jgi:Fe-S oxidoreductase